MFEDSYDYDYDRLIDDSEDLLDDDYYNDEQTNPNYRTENYPEFDYYYHNLTEELIDE